MRESLKQYEILLEAHSCERPGHTLNHRKLKARDAPIGPTKDPGPLPLVRVSSIEGLHAPVAQLDRALPSEGKGRTFESSRARQHLATDRHRAGQILAVTNAPAEFSLGVRVRQVARRRQASRLRHIVRAELYHRPRLAHDRHQAVA